MGHVYVIEVFHIKLNLNNLYQASIYLKTHLIGFLYAEKKMKMVQSNFMLKYVLNPWFLS